MQSVEYTHRLPTIKIQTLISVGERNECDPALSKAMPEKISGCKLAIMPRSGHMAFGDQPKLYEQAVDEFLQEKP